MSTKIFATDLLKVGGFILSGSGTSLFFAGNQLAQGSSAVAQIQQVIAGSGLEGGGAFNSANVTLNIGAGSGIFIDGDKVNVATQGVITSMLADGALTNAKVSASAAIDVTKLQYSGITIIGGSGLQPDSSIVNLGGSVTLNIATDNSTLDINSDLIRVKPLGISNAQISNSAAIDVTKLQYSGSSVIAGSGIQQDSSTLNLGGSITLNVATDNSTLEVDTDALRLKALGINNTHISNSAAISVTKLQHSGVTIMGGSGLQPDNSTLNLGNSLTLNVVTDNSTLEVNADGLRVKAAGLSNTHIGAGAAIDVTKLQYSGVTIIGGSGLQPDSVTAYLGGSTTLHVATDNSTIEINADGLRVKGLGLSNAHISETAAISISKLQHSGINFSYANGLTGSLTTSLTQTNPLSLTIDSNTLSAGGNNTLRVLRTSGVLSSAALHAGLSTFTHDGASNTIISVDGTVVRTSGNQTIAGTKTFANDIVVIGNFQVSGNITQISSNEVNIGDNTIVLNADVDAQGVGASDGGFVVHTGLSGQNPELLWNHTYKKWTISKNPTQASFEIVSSQRLRAGTIALATNDYEKTVYFNYAFPSAPVVTATLKAPPNSDLIGWQVNNVTTTGVSFDFTTSMPNNNYVLQWQAMGPIGALSENVI